MKAKAGWALAAAVMGVALAQVNAATETWANNGTNMSTAANWTPSGVPGANGTILFASPATVNPQLNASIQLYQIGFSGTNASGYILSSASSSYAITLYNQSTNVGGFSAIYAANTSGTNTISANLILAGTAGGYEYVGNPNAGTSIVLSGNISGTTGLAKGGLGSLTLSGTNSFSGGFSYAGGNVGTVYINSTTALGSGTVAFGDASGSTNNAQIDNGSGADVTLTNNPALSLGGTTYIGSANSLNFGTGNITLDGTNVPVTVNGYTLTLGGSIQAGTGGLTKKGVGTLVLSGNNAYTSLTTVNGGTLTLSGNNSSASGGVTLTTGTLDINNANALGTGTLAINGGTIDNTTSGTITNPGNNAITIGATFAFGGTHSLNLGTGAITNAGNRTITLNGTTSTLTLGGTMTNTSGAAQTTTVSGTGNTLVLGGYALSNSSTSYVDVVNGTGNVTITGAVVNGGTSTAGGLNYKGTGTLTLSSTSNSYGGATTVSSGTLTSGASNVLPDASDVTVGSSTTFGTLSLAGYTDTVKSLTFGSFGNSSLSLTLGTNTATRLTTTGNATLTNGTVTLTGSPDGTVGKYTLIKATGSLTGTPTLTAPTGYRVNEVTGTGGELDLIHKATIGTISATPARASIITGGSTTFTFTVANSAPTGSDSLSFSTSAGTNTTGSVGSGVTVPAQSTSSAQSGLSFNGTTIGAGQTGSFSVSDSNATNTPQTGTVTVDVYDHATIGSFTDSSVSVGNIHQGYAAFTSVSSLSVTNGAGTDYRVNLKGSGSTANGFSLSSMSGVTRGSSGVITPNVPAGLLPGPINQALTYTFADDSTLSNASVSLATKNITVTGNVYSGKSTWTGGANSTWNDFSNWTTLGGVPGVDGALSRGQDTATFDSTGQSRATVNLDGTSPELNTVTLNSPTSYTIAPGTGYGMLKLSGAGAAISVTGTHSITAPLLLNADTQVGMTNTVDVLTVSGPVSGDFGVTKTGSGTLVLATANAYKGATSVNQGTLTVNGSLAAESAVTVAGGATVGGNGTILGSLTVAGTVAPGNAIGDTATLTTGAETWESTGAYAVDINDAAGTAGGATGWDSLVMDSLTQSDGFTVQVLSSGTPANFSGTGIYQWVIAEVKSGSFNISQLKLDTTGFTGGANSLFSLDTTTRGGGGQDLVLSYTYNAVPEATTLLLGMVGLAPLLLQRRRAATSRAAGIV